MVEAILEDSKKIVPCAALCQGEYGINGVFIGVPVKLGRQGAEEIVRFSLNEDEQAALAKSAALVQELCGVVDAMI
jgi:malate dehydrogenase